MEALIAIALIWAMTRPCVRKGHDWTAPQQATRWRRSGIYTQAQTTVFVTVCTRCGTEKARRPR